MNGPAHGDGLFEAHLTVSDLSRSVAFYRDIVGLTLAYEVPERGAAFFWIGEPGRSMLGLWALGSAPVSLSLHIAFATSPSMVIGACERLRSVGITPLSFSGEETDEPSVIGWMPAAAVYFRDPDDHLLEYLAMLPTPPRVDAGIVPWSEWALLAEPEAPRIRWHHGPRHTLRDLFALADDSSRQIDRYIDLGRVLVVEDDQGEIAGHLQLIPCSDPDIVEIKSLAVRIDTQRRGYGGRLVSEALDWCGNLGARAVTVTTAVADVTNIRFYQRCGFRAVAIERDAFLPEDGYPADDARDGIPIRDAIRFEQVLAPTATTDER
jgi:lactoylglutathione lyase